MEPLNDVSDQKELKRMMKKNAELLEENNHLLRKIHRNAQWAFWIRVIWYLVIVGLPFALYFYVLEPYFSAMGSSYETLLEGLRQLPGLYNLDLMLNGSEVPPEALNFEANQVE